MTVNHTLLADVANAIRSLSIDAIDAANSGHPGLPLGCAEIGAYLYAQGLQHNPKDPQWMGRDRFILSAGHGSMLLYACLHLAGFDLPLDDIKQFRQLHSKCPGHPEYREAPGVECTTGPLGQGVGMGIGMALGQAMAQAQYKAHDLLQGYTYILAGDGCMMEGIAAEASSLAGHLALGRVILYYDSNDICLDGPTDECFIENTAARYESYGWHVQTIDGHDFDAIHAANEAAKAHTSQPSLIIAKTVIGKGSPNREGTSEAHGKALGEEESRLTKERLGLPVDQPFYVPESVTQFFASRCNEQAAAQRTWQAQFDAWATANPDLAAQWAQVQQGEVPAAFDAALQAADLSGNKATRQSSGGSLQVIHDTVPFVVGGSADLSCSDNTMMKASGVISKDDFSARNIKYGVREFAMSAMTNGIALFGLHTPYCGTFFTFSDYMKNAIRLAAIMELNVVYQFTHDSIFVGEDGPTHQPVEHLASLRSIPGVTVIRPANANEVKGAWKIGLSHPNPVAIVLTRQGVSDDVPTQIDQVEKGAYILSTDGDDVDFCLLATGSEVTLAQTVADELRQEGHRVRLVSVPSFELFDKQSCEYRQSVLGMNATVRASIEAQCSFGWHKYIGWDGVTIAIDSFGVSAPGKVAAEHFGFTPDAVKARLLKQLERVKQYQTTGA